MSAKKTQVLLIAGALVLTVLLFIAPKLAPMVEPGEQKAATAVSPSQTLELYVNMALKNVEPNEKATLEKLAQAKLYDSIAAFWDKVKRPDLASHYIEQKAILNNKPQDWFNAGSRYYYSVQFCKDNTEIPVLYQCAMRCFNKGLVMDPDNTEAKIMLASCFVEGSGEPMVGITQLKEIEKTDSNNVRLQLSFAFFSVKSGQTEKAIERFKKVLRIDSTYIAAYLHLADAYEQQENTEQTIKMLEQYVARTNDVTAKIEINKYIQQLRTK